MNFKIVYRYPEYSQPSPLSEESRVIPHTVWYGSNMNADDPFNVEQQKKEIKKMRGLYEVFIVNPDGEEIEFRGLIIAKDEKGAQLKALQKSSELVGDLEDYDIIAVKLGPIRSKKEVQEVKVIKDEK